MILPDPAHLAQLVRKGDRRALARAITLVESSRADHRQQAERLLVELTPHAGRSIRIGISGAPGVGKSTFVESFGNHVIDEGQRVAVLSIDPSSAISGGSILGDKTRMASLSHRSEAYIRPSPAGQTLGGVARRTREAMLICEAAGFEVIVVETVGVGQSETAVAEMTDIFVLLVLPGGGDELQGIKRGIMELADLILINKADGDMVAEAHRTASAYRHALRLMQGRSQHWKIPVETCSACKGTGVAEAWQTIQAFRANRVARSEFAARRASQSRAWLWSETAEILLDILRRHPQVRSRLSELEAAVAGGLVPASVAARDLVELVARDRLDAGPVRIRQSPR